MVHQVIKPEVIASTAAVLLEQSLVVPAAFQREGIDQFKGADNDTINVVVEGVLPYRTYGWRNDRSTSIQFDEYSERKVPITFGGDIYSAVRLTDEQNDFDLNGWTKLALKQTEAIGRGLEYKAVDAALAAPYEIDVVLDGTSGQTLKSSLIKLRAVFNKLRVPGSRQILIGTDIEQKLLEADVLSEVASVGESDALAALHEAKLGRRYGFDFITAEEMPATEGIAMVPSAFVFLTGAPSVPQSVPFGATASHNGVALTWLRDYETEKRRDRSVFNTYYGFDHVSDPLVGKDGVTNQAYVSTDNHFVRAVKVSVGSAYSVEVDNDELAEITGVTSTDGTNDGL